MTRVPRRLLAPDERVVLATRPHGKRLVRPVLVLLVVAPLTTFAVAVLDQPMSGVAVTALGTLVVLRFTGLPFLRWLSTTYVLTDRRLVVRGGLFSRWGRDLPLSWITEVTFRRGLVGRLVGAGTLAVESTGEGGRLVLPDVPRVAEVQREIYRLAETARDRRGAA